jgi:hypothetical protein
MARWHVLFQGGSESVMRLPRLRDRLLFILRRFVRWRYKKSIEDGTKASRSGSFSCSLGVSPKCDLSSLGTTRSVSGAYLFDRSLFTSIDAHLPSTTERRRSRQTAGS